MLGVETQTVFEKLLVDEGLLTREQLDELRVESARENKSILALITEKKVIPNEAVVKALAKAENVPYADLRDFNVDKQFLSALPKELASSYMMVPIGEQQGRLAVGMLDPTNLQAVDFMSRKIGRSLSAYMVSQESIDAVLAQYKDDVSKEVSDVISTVSDIDIARAKEESQNKDNKDKKKTTAKNVLDIVQDAPITRALNTIIEYAAKLRASDIHIEPTETELKIRFRVDGLLQEVMTLPKTIEAPLVSRIKILSNLKIDEHRIPQDGQFNMEFGENSIDFRIAIAPVAWGEQVVIRLLDKSKGLLTLEDLGFQGQALRVIKEGIKKPHGMTLSTGPTGSGKSTSLYAIIQAIKDVTINIVTLEDPVEYKMNGINQMQVNSDVGLTFASGLRSILRQDPDAVMVGEIRDKETASLAVQAALTGHIVLSTLHTNSAAGVLPRLLDMEVEPFLIASTVNTAIGQRLVRRICKECIEEYQASKTEIESIKKVLKGVLPEDDKEAEAAKEKLGYEKLPKISENAYTLYRGKGCGECTNGYKGRVGVFEVFAITDAIEKLLADHATTSAIQNQAIKEGLVTMKQDGYLKALNGATTLEEVARVAADD